MEFRILGPVEVVDDGRSVALGPSKQRALLAVLLLHVNEVVSRDRLIDDLWGERAPETAATALHGYVSQLRKVLEPNNRGEHRLLVTRAPGYVLELEPGQVDLKRFELLAHRGKRELTAANAVTAAATLAEALALWRGTPLTEFSSAPFALAEGLRLQELLVSTVEDRIEADLALGRHHELVGELERLVREHPFRERLYGQLMLALYRGGRQAEALEVYRKARRKLADELGIDPGPELQELQQAILRHEQAIARGAATGTERTIEALPPTAAPVGKPIDSGAARTAERVAGQVRRGVLRWGLLAAATLVALALVLAFALGGREARAIQLAPNHVGFIDGKSGRVTRSFAVGREPRALAVGFGSVWVADYQDQTVTRIDSETGRPVTIPVGGHPTGIAASAGGVWVWTLEGSLVPVDPRFDSAGRPVRLQPQTVRTGGVLGAIAAGGGFLWVTAPPTTVIRVESTNLRRHLRIVPDAGAQGPIAYGDDKAWVAGSTQVFPIEAHTRIPGSGIQIGAARDLALAGGDLWVVSGGPAHLGGVAEALRRVDLESGLVAETITVGGDPFAVAAAAGSIWAASRSDGTVSRVDPRENRVVDTISVGASPTALAADKEGVWVAVE